MTTPPVPSTLAAWTAFRRFPWLALTVALMAVKLAWLIADHTPMLFLGDSESYLWTALTGWIPPDRSFLYGFLLRPLAVDAGSMLPLIAAQSASSVVVALLLAWALVFNLTHLPYAMWFKIAMFSAFPLACIPGIRYGR